MITWRITFLLAINLKQEVNQIQKKPKRPAKLPKKKKKVGSKKSSKSKLSKKARREGIKRLVVNEEDVNYSIIQVSEPVKYLHIEYELFPKKFTYAIDLVCWGPVAKIYAANGSKCLKTVVQNDFIWVPVFIEHYIEELDTQDIKSLLEHAMQISIKIGKNNVGTQAKNDKITTFYQFKDDEKNSFSEVYNSTPSSDQKDKMKNEIEAILNKLLLLPVKKEIISWIYNIDEAHAFQISKILTKRFRGDEVYGKDCIVDEKDHGESGPKSSKKRIKSSKSKSSKANSKSSKNKSRKSKSVKNSKGQTKFNDSTIHFKIPASTFIADPLLATFETKETNGHIPEAYVLLSSDNLLTFSQKMELALFIIKIRKISNLTSDILRKHGFEKVYLKCTLPGITEFETLPKTLSETIRFNDSRVICTNDISKIKLLEILQTKRTYVEIIGVKEILAPTIIKTAKPKKNKKRRKPVKKIIPEPRTLTENVVLAKATYDLSSLTRTFFVFKQKQSCCNLKSMFDNDSKNVDDYFLDHLTVNELNSLEYPNRTNPSPLDNDILMWNNTTVKFEAHFLAPQYPSFRLKAISSAYKRFMIVIFDEDIAKSLMRDMVLFNSKLQGPTAMLLPNLLACNKKNNSESMLSGFIIDDGNCFIFYLEGLANGGILNMLYHVSNYSYPKAKVFYNSEYLFEERIYSFIFSRTGFLVINLKMPLKDIFESQQIFVAGNIPTPCLIAMQKLHLLFKSNRFKTILNHNILPTEFELISLSLEFGVTAECEKGIEEIHPSMESSVIPLNTSKLF